MMRTSYSPIFSEGLDFCALILDRDGELVAMQINRRCSASRSSPGAG